MTDFLLLADNDDVAVALHDLTPGERLTVAGRHIIVRADVPAGHKLAVTDTAAGAPIHKYGQRIGVAATPIRVGEHVHTHNLAYGDGTARARASGGIAADSAVRQPDRTFQGYRRPGRSAGTRNYVGILTTVNCSATVAKLVAEQFRRPGRLDDFPNVDGVVASTHGTGCGMAGSGEGMDILRRTLRGYAAHPNIAGVLVIGLGCEVNQVEPLAADLPAATPYSTMTIQDHGGTASTVREATERVSAMLADADRARREPIPTGDLVLGLQCGGSDGYSGITANPALGVASDLLVDHGGTSILGETPEIYGAEHLLAARAVDDEVGKRLLDRIRWWERYTVANGGSMDNNPSPGNKTGGITTILEKSLGAVAKAGSRPLSAVYEYAETVTARGLTFMDTPGYDPVSVTGMVAGGATVVVFTTGRGSVFGCRPAPSIKVATNTPIYDRMAGDMDLDAGRIAGGTASVAAVGAELFELIVDVASGRRTASEELGFGAEEFVPWQLGAVM
ncbi:MAG: UxaA family hydrolase [Mycobacteriales bacterium]